MSLESKVQDFVKKINKDIKEHGNKTEYIKATMEVNDKEKSIDILLYKAGEESRVIYRVYRQDSKVFHLRYLGTSLVSVTPVCHIKDVDEWFWGGQNPVNFSWTDSKLEDIRGILSRRAEKYANQKLEQEINKELNDLWDKREYKI